MIEVIDSHDQGAGLDRNALVRKDNGLITAKYKATLLENQITSICLSRVREQNGNYIATITSNELKKLFGMKGSNTSIYKRLESVAKRIGGRMLVVEDPEGFDIINIITDASYRDGVFSMRFNDKMNPYFANLKGRYTTYTLANILNFKCDYSFRIYELLKKEAFRITKDNPVVPVTYSLAEFKCMIGIVDINTDKIQKEMEKKVVDWDKIIEMAPEMSYPAWGDFRRYVLDKAQKEINAMCDVAFDYTPIKSGKGGKVVELRLMIRKNDKYKKKLVEKTEQKFEEINSEYEKEEPYKMSPELIRYIGHNELKKKDLNIFLEDAGGDNELVIRCIEEADKQPDIRNYIGWIRKCIRSGGYSDDVPVINGSSSDARFIESVRKDVEDNEDDIAAGYWVKVRDKKSGKFPQFLKYLSDNGMDLTMFEAANTPAECANKFLDWSKGDDIDLI